MPTSAYGDDLPHDLHKRIYFREVSRDTPIYFRKGRRPSFPDVQHGKETDNNNILHMIIAHYSSTVSFRMWSPRVSLNPSQMQIKDDDITVNGDVLKL